MNEIGASISSASASGMSGESILLGLKMKRLDLVGCAACLSKSHVFSGNYDFCREFCPACGIDLRKNEHVAIDCDQRPKSKSEAIRMAGDADRSGDTDRKA